MKRTLTVILLAGAALALLVGAALKSRSIPLETHIARYTLNSDVSRLQDDFNALLASLQASWRLNQAPGEATRTLQRRIVASVPELEQTAGLMPGNAAQRDRIRNNLVRLSSTVSRVDELATAVISDQTGYAESLTLLRDSSAEVVRQLRAIGETRVAADLFQLIAETIDYAAPDRNLDQYQIRRLLPTLTRDIRIDSSVSSLAGTAIESINTILNSKGDIESRLNQLALVSLIEHSEALNAAAGAAYQGAALSADRARTMLSTYAVIMLLAVGVIGYRLRASYSQLNRANDELGHLNESLEQRVEARTEDLSNALDELKESQVQLVQAEKMSSLGQLVAGISHEINTPLLYLENNASLIRERIEALREFVRRSTQALSINPSDFDDRSEYQRQLIQGLKNLKTMLRELELEATVEEIADLNSDSMEGLGDLTEIAQSLKDFSRLDRAPVDSFDVNQGIDKTLTIARNIVKHKANVRKFYGEIPHIECSPSKVNQVFLNLVTNAAQAIEEFGEIVISTRVHDDEHIAISVSDTGCGIPADIIDKIRDPFFTTKEVGTGTGLGLSIVDDIVRSHGGELLIESRVGEGSTFTVVLPIRQPEESAEAADRDRPADSKLAEAV